mgnify:CR=1 FL=1
MLLPFPRAQEESGSTTFLLLTQLLPCSFSLISATTPEDQERFVSSIIKSLDSGDPAYQRSTATCRAYLFRAELYTLWKRFDAAKADAERGIQLLQMTEDSSTRSLLLSQLYRVLSDIHEANENWQGAMAALRAQAASNQSMRSKVAKELERLQERAAGVTI